MAYKREVVVLVGLPASGKSTFYNERFRDTHVRINLDMLRTRNREKMFLTACLETFQPFVVDNTNISVIDRIGYVSPAKKKGFTATCYYFVPDVERSLDWNERRGDLALPEVAIRSKAASLTEPSYDEGFDDIFFVEISDIRGFDIWRKEGP